MLSEAPLAGVAEGFLRDDTTEGARQPLGLWRAPSCVGAERRPVSGLDSLFYTAERDAVIQHIISVTLRNADDHLVAAEALDDVLIRIRLAVFIVRQIQQDTFPFSRDGQVNF